MIGGGFIGSEIAAALVGNGCRVTMLFPEPGIGFRLFPLGLSQFVADYYREKGVDVRTERAGRIGLGRPGRDRVRPRRSRRTPSSPGSA